MSTTRYERLNTYVMGILYSPLLLLTSFLETRHAKRIALCRRLSDANGNPNSLNGDDMDDGGFGAEWEEMSAHLGLGEQVWEREGWKEKVEASRPNVEVDAAVAEVRRCRVEIEALKEMVGRLLEAQGQGVRVEERQGGGDERDEDGQGDVGQAVVEGEGGQIAS